MADVRGVSTSLGFVLSVAVTVLLVGGLLTAAGGLVTDKREGAVRDELEVVGNHLAADLVTADRLARATDGGTVRVASPLPERVAGQPYRIRVRADADGTVITLETSNPDVTVAVPVENSTRVSDATARGGRLVVRYDGTALEVADGD